MQFCFTNYPIYPYNITMLLSFTCENYYSILEPVELSLVATSDRTHSETLLEFSNIETNRISLIYGPNGSGKSAILDALYSLRQNVILSNKNDPDDPLIGYHPHKLSTSGYCSMEIYFVKNSTKYYYGIKYNNNKVIEESLYYSPNGRIGEIFSRNESQIHFSDKFRRYEQNIQNGLLRENKLLLSVLACNTDSIDILSAYSFFRNELLFCNREILEKIVEPSKEIAEEPEKEKEYVALFRLLGFDLTGIRVSRKQFNFEELPDIFKSDDDIKARFEQNPYLYRTEFINSLFSVELSSESSGTQALYCLVRYILKFLSEDIVLLCDELESNMHTQLVRKIIEVVKNNSKTESQLVCTTHDVNLLSGSLLRRDQIFFSELDMKKRSTRLTCLSEIKNVRATENLRTNYLNGKYGGLPEIEENSNEEE